MLDFTTNTGITTAHYNRPETGVTLVKLGFTKGIEASSLAATGISNASPNGIFNGMPSKNNEIQ